MPTWHKKVLLAVAPEDGQGWLVVDNELHHLPASVHKGSCPILLADVLKEKIHDVRCTWRVGDGGKPVKAIPDLDLAMSL